MDISAYNLPGAEQPAKACRVAAQRAYRELRDHGIRDEHAFGAAVRLFQHHFPATPSRDAKYIVAGWLAPDA